MGMIIDIENKIKSMIKDGKIMYSTIFGSRLYGTSKSGKSDLDIRGIYLPSKRSLLIGQPIKTISYTSGGNINKNTQNDVDISMIPLHIWLNQLQSGDTGAIDMLFSFTNKDCVQYTCDKIKYVQNNPLKFINPSKATAYIGYCMGQARKYGLKGSSVNVIQETLKIIDEHPEYIIVKDISDILFNKFKDNSLVKYIDNGAVGSPFIAINGRLYGYKLKIKDLRVSLQSHYDKYGHRAKEAANNENVDWKAVSHAYRCTQQMKDLLTQGKIEFPLRYADKIMKIKYGECTWNEIGKLLAKEMEDIKYYLEKTKFNTPVDSEFVNNFILSCYDFI